MRIQINNFSKFKRAVDKMFNKLMHANDKAIYHETYFAVEKTRRTFKNVIPNQSSVTKIMRSGEDPFITCWNNHPFRTLGVGTTTGISGVQAASLICNAIKVREDHIILPVYINNSYTAVEIYWSNEEGWEIEHEMFKRRTDPGKFVRFFNDLVRYIEIDYYNTMDVDLEGRI